MGRLASGATLPQLQSRLDQVARDLRLSYPVPDARIGFVATSHEHLVVPRESPGALASMGLVWAMILVLHLIACSNVALLMLARVNARRRELGIRLCLGASRARIIQQILTEAGALALMGGAGGLLVAYWLTTLITRMEFLSAFHVSTDARVICIVALVTLLSCLQCGYWPARSASRADPVSLLGGGATGRVVGERAGATGFILAFQVSLSLVLVADAAVLLRTFQREHSAPPGLDAAHLVVGSVSLSGARHTKADWRSAYEDALTRAAAIPGVRSVAAAAGAPLYKSAASANVAANGVAVASGVSAQRVGPGYFATLGAPLVAGREFATSDVGSGQTGDVPCVIVNESFARRVWPNGAAIGRSLVIDGHTATVIGIAPNIHDVSQSILVPRVYEPLMAALDQPFDIIARTRGAPDAIVAQLRTAIEGATGERMPAVVTTMASIQRDASAVARAGGEGLSVCAALALLLTAIGLYGMVGNMAARRQGEVGVRLALGAPLMRVRLLLLGSVLRLTLVGGVIGTLMAALLVRIESGWWGPSVAFEPLAVAGAMAAFLLSAGLAAYVPAHRAAAATPASVLRNAE